MTAAAISKSIPSLHVRDTTRAIEIQDEIQLIYTVFRNALEIAREVAGKVLQVPKDKEVVVNPKKIPFKVTAEFLVRLVEPSAPNVFASGKKLTTKNVEAVKTFLQKAHLASPYFENPHQKIKEEECRSLALEMATPLQIAYRQRDNRFQKIDIPPTQQKLSCFDYVIVKAGFGYPEFYQFLRSATKGQRKASFFDYIDFLKSKQMTETSLPLQAGDILVYYYDDKDQISHAALVAKDPRKVYAKPGDNLPFAYLHLEEETPIMYGKRFQIFRKK